MDYDGIKLCEQCGEYTTGRLCNSCREQEAIDEDSGADEDFTTDDVMTTIDEMTEQEVVDALNEELESDDDEWWHYRRDDWDIPY